jgi:hypothetical protein
MCVLQLEVFGVNLSVLVISSLPGITKQWAQPLVSDRCQQSTAVCATDTAINMQ